MQPTIYIIVFAHENGTDFVRAVCDDVIQLMIRLERLLPPDSITDEEKFCNKLEKFKLVTIDIGNGSYHIYESSMNTDINIFL